MRTRRYITLAVAVVLALLILSLPTAPLAADSPDQPRGKVSGLLRYHVELKQEQMSQPDNGRLAQMEDLGLRTESLSQQLVFVHFDQHPDSGQVDELQAMGITLYKDSWIPPLDGHPDGFMVAQVPVDKVYALANNRYVTYLNTAEKTYQPMNNLGVESMKADDLWSLGYDGSGVTVAVLDSGLDTSHSDIPAPTHSKDYSDFPTLDDTIANTVTDHGTHVTGSVLGRGVYTTTYKGAAPDADLVFLKIGNDTTSRASTAAIVGAIRASVDTYDADIVTMSYGGFSTYMDGTSEEGQAVDYAFSKGAVVFIAAGNEADNDLHYSGEVDGSSDTGWIRVNVADPSPDQTRLVFQLIWFDGSGTSNDLELEIYDSSKNQITSNVVTTEEPESSRGTESDQTYLSTWITSARTYYLKVVNNATSKQDFHIYSSYSEVTFASPDSAYTVGSPATANNAIAVGAYVSRDGWTDWQGNGWSYSGQVLNNMATFSSQGPRADGVKKPNIAAPGSAIISADDSNVATNNSYLISDNGINDGSQDHHYRVMQGTSMATPLAAGAAALLLDKYPKLKGHPDLIRDRIQRTADNSGVQTNTDGYGHLDILAAAKLIESPNTVSSAYAGKHGAPSKIVVTILKPDVGLSASDFTVEINGTNASIITMFESSTEYVLEVMPPDLADGLYDLRVSVAGVGDTAGPGAAAATAIAETQPDAVFYADTNSVDVALIIDRSGSMGSGAGSDLQGAKDAAKQFVDFMHDNDKVGVVSFSSSASVDFGLTTITPGSGGGSPAFSDDMESGTSQWTADSPWALIDSDSHSPTHSWTDSPGGNYANNADVSLTSNQFSLASMANPSLSFWTHHNLESGYDYGYVEVSTDGGTSWTQLTSYNGTQTSWINAQLSLAAYAGEASVQIRFRLDTDYSVTRDGWYIDDVEVAPDSRSTKDLVKSGIDAISGGGLTSMGDGLQKGQDELTGKGDATHPWAIVFLSDGYENRAPYVAAVLPAVKSTKTVVHTIALGSADEDLLMDMAAQTGGTYNMAPTADQLAAIYDTIAGAVSGEQTLFSETGVVEQGVTDEKSVVVDSTVSEATFSVRWANSASDIDLTLEKPDGSTIDPAVAASNADVDYVSSSTYEYYRVKSPTLVAGVWKMKVTGGSISTTGKGVIVTADGEPYTARVTGRASLSMHSYLDKSSYLAYEPVKISVTLSDNQPIRGATVMVGITPPTQMAALVRATEWIEVNGDTMPDPAKVAEIEQSVMSRASISSLTLYDDGAHGDGQADDGVYANTLSGINTGQIGTYTFDVSASGTSNSSDSFNRQTQHIVSVAANSSPPSFSYLPIVIRE